MIPTAGYAQVLVLRDRAQLRAALDHTRVSAAGAEIMEKKGVFRVVRVRGLKPAAANILKQEMLSRGGEAAISREAFEMGGERADCILMGTLAQFEQLLPKLKAQPFGLRALSASIEVALRNYENASPECPPDLKLTNGPLLMGILNLTPDSFSDGDSYPDLETAVNAGLQMIEQGADLIDLGGESTRPGSDPVPLEEELQRVLPAVRELAPLLPKRISVDTCKARVAAEALAAGAYMVNDISALRMDPEMVAVVRDAECPVILMHMLGRPKTMQDNPTYGDVVEEVYAFLLERLNWAVDNGLKEENLLVDPGLGFGKTTAHNLMLLRDLGAFRSLGRPIVVGASRKRFLGEVLDIAEPRRRDSATAAATVVAAAAGAHVLRVHSVPENRDAARLTHAVFGAGRASL